MIRRERSIITQAIIDSDEILNKSKPRTSERIATIKTARLMLDDMSPSKVRRDLQKQFNKAINIQRKADGCPTGYKKTNDVCKHL